MATLYIDGFDHYGTATDAGWSNGTISATNPRTGSYALNVTSSHGTITRSIGSTPATLIMGIAARTRGAFSGNLAVIEFRDGITQQVGVYTNADGTLTVKRNGPFGTTLAGPSASALSTLTYHHVEFKATINNSGSFELRVDGATWLSGSSVDTQQSANAYATTVATSYLSSSGCDIDDVYLFDSTGSSNNDFVGDVKVQTLMPSGAGNTTAWTPSSGSNYTCVDEAQANGDTDYISTSNATDKDTYAFGNIGSSPTVHAVAVAMHARKDDAGTRTIVSVVRHSSTDYDGGTSHSLTSSYLQYRQNYDVNPGTSAAWTASDVDGAEFGVKLTA